MKKICCICGKAKEINILIRGKMICSACEYKIAGARACTNRYELISRRIREEIPVNTDIAAG
ncbi:MAG: carnitine--CoA ligase [Eubacteriales bacterium]|nr:carnitine--CoA ligase [Eubacteriales bacterium]